VNNEWMKSCLTFASREKTFSQSIQNLYECYRLGLPIIANCPLQTLISVPWSNTPSRSFSGMNQQQIIPESSKLVDQNNHAYSLTPMAMIQSHFPSDSNVLDRRYGIFSILPLLVPVPPDILYSPYSRQ